MTAIEKRTRTMFPDLFDWLDDFPRMPWKPFAETQPIRFEDYEEDGRYVLKAELPGIDPDRDVEVTISDGLLTVHGERREETRSKYHSEFRYGSFSRSVRLPRGANEDDVTATYNNGILTITVGLSEEKPEAKRITISKA